MIVGVSGNANAAFTGLSNLGFRVDITALGDQINYTKEYDVVVNATLPSDEQEINKKEKFDLSRIKKSKKAIFLNFLYTNKNYLVEEAKSLGFCCSDAVEFFAYQAVEAVKIICKSSTECFL